jgi:hypothetical protein
MPARWNSGSVRRGAIRKLERENNSVISWRGL